MDRISRKKSADPEFAEASSGVVQFLGRKPVRVVIADDDPVILDYLVDLVGASFHVVGTAKDGRELVEAVKQLAPSVVVADVAMPHASGIEAAKQITGLHHSPKVVLLSGYTDDALVDAAFEAGASAYVGKLSAFTDLIPAIEKVLEGRQFRSVFDSFPVTQALV